MNLAHREVVKPVRRLSISSAWIAQHLGALV
jgi:hypothetical protein